ncbi:sensor histidine kinase [Metabacillus iocasae]|uniref:histidine kinase n=1 Tax=Priestia iocasae TaxID=2291674 RepID=A0ABS2QUR5_9BACI|nr:HAMP domain-containing sensor histidine kinase [Metabacillus iocasae]MBM7703199.1 signal transduction histidine kinase [Metabacillus iocasae]
MRKYIRNLSIFNKTVLFSTFIVILVGIGTAYISYKVQESMTEEMLSHHALSIADIWKQSQSVEQIIATKEDFNEIEKNKASLAESLSTIYGTHPPYLQSHIFSAKKEKNQTIEMIVSTNKELSKQKASINYTSDTEFYRVFQKVTRTKKDEYTSIYKNEFGTWITAFTPIMNHDQEVIAILAVDVDASIISTYQRELVTSLVMGLLFLFSIIIFFQDWGLRKLMFPLRELLFGIKQVSNGNLRMKVKHEDESEIGEINKQFNEMTTQLEVLFKQVAATTEELGEKAMRSPSTNGIEKAINDMGLIMEKTKLQKEFQRAEKMNAIGQLAASVAHEIRNPMTVVKGFLQLFHGKEHLTSSEKGYIQLMIDEMHRAELIINDYLSLARPGMEQLEVLNCKECVTSLVDLLSSYALLNNNIIIDLQVKRTVYIKGNKNEFNQVLLNIMKNGIESMKEGGVLKVSMETKGDVVDIHITDTGIGMSKEEKSRLGTPFYSLKEKGTGIGLMVSYQIIESMKGTILVASEKGVGSTFTISLPIHRPF